LRALKLCHPRCIDTALIYHHPRGRPLKPGLAWLTNKWCGREIQTRGEGGHDPEEDARACLELLKKKVANGSSGAGSHPEIVADSRSPPIVGRQDPATESSRLTMSPSLTEFRAQRRVGRLGASDAPSSTTEIRL
jgi:DNA polymerase III epsilon subunit-like protein